MAIDFNQERRVINDPNASIADKVAATKVHRTIGTSVAGLMMRLNCATH